MNRYEKLWHENSFVPVRMYGFEVVRSLASFSMFVRCRFRHPCPCKGWGLDKIFYIAWLYAGTFPLDRNDKKLFRQTVRLEAVKHVREFLEKGTVDGLTR